MSTLQWVIAGVLYLVSTLAAGAFFYWLTQSVVRLRASEHRQSNVMTEVVLLVREIHAHVVRRPGA